MVDTLVDALTDAATDDSLRAIHIRGAGDDFCAGADWVATNAGGQRPRTGDLVRRIPHTAHTASIELVAHHPPSGGVHRAGLGRRPRLQPRAGRRLHRGRRRRGVLGAVPDPRLQPGLRLDVAAAPAGRRGTSQADAAARREGHGIRCGGLGADPPRGDQPELDDAAEELLARLASGPTVAIGLAKQAIHYGQHATLPQTMNQELFNLELSCRTTDFKEGLAAFRERRPPEFNGR